MAKLPIQETKTKKRFYLPWPWSLLVYILLAVVLRIFSIPLILLLLWWNKKQQPDGPADGSVTSRITGDSLCQLLHQCRRDGETRTFQLVPGIPFQREGHTFCRLICDPGSGQETVQFRLEENSGAGWCCRVPAGEAETILRDWLWGRIPTLRGWTSMGSAAR